MKRRDFLRRVSGGTVAVAAGAVASAESAEKMQPGGLERLASPFPGHVERRGDLKVRIGEIRLVMRGPMFPGLARFADGSIVLYAQAEKEGGPLTAIRSEDLGDTWKPHDVGIDGLGLNTLQLTNGTAISTHYDTRPLEGQPGWRSTKRWESDDNWQTVRGPIEDGRLYLPPDQFDPAMKQWFHGNTIEMPNGNLLAAMQGAYQPRRFRTFISRSMDGGKTWRFQSHVASLDTLDDPQGATKTGWTLWGPCEPNIVHVGGGALVCTMRLVNDDANPLMAEPSDTYHDLSYTVPGNGIHPGTRFPADKYYRIGPPTAPLAIAYSSDAGASWTPGKPMTQARGCFPRMALSEGLLALTYGALAYPRWGNCISFTTDGGKTWTDEINYGPFLTTGYTDILAIGPRRFLVVFDCTPPQPWANHAAHWVGALDIAVG